MDDQTLMASGLKEAQLIVREGPESGATFPLPKEAIIIGREAEADITIKDPEISRRHARISWQAGSYVIEDLGSTNGTTLNGVKITGIQKLNPGDTIEIGQSVLTLQWQAEESGPPQTPSSTMKVAPPAPSVSPVSPPAAEEKPKEGKSKCLMWGCGCLALLILLLVVIVVVATFLLPSVLTPEQLQDLQRILDDNQIPIQLSLGNLVRLMV